MRSVTAGPFGERLEAPVATYVRFDRPQQLTAFVHEGKIDDGCEPNGAVLSWEAIEAMNASARTRQPCQFLAVGETRYSDGRHFLDLAMNPAWIERNTDYRFLPGHLNPVYVCPDCEGVAGEHSKVQIPDPSGGRAMTVKCPQDTSRSFRR